MSDQEIPIVCTLNDAAFREREENVLNKLLPTVVEMQETERGYLFSFPTGDETLADVCEFIRLERQCCSFLDFRLTVASGNGDISLELTGPYGAKEFIASTFVR